MAAVIQVIGPGLRRFLVAVVVAVLAGAGGAFWLAGLSIRRSAASAATPSRPRDGGHVAPSDPRVAGVFEALRRRGLPAALVALAQAADRDSAVLRDAHQLAHALGRDAVVKAGDASVLRACGPAFGSGCYHGVVEGFLQTRGRIDMAELEALCSGLGEADRQPGVAYECVHGLGHGIFGALGLDLEATLQACDALSTPNAAHSCHTGAFMEAINSALAGAGTDAAHIHGAMHGAHAAHRISLDPANPYSPCDRYRDPYTASCWLFQAFVILRRHNFDAGPAFRTCDAAPNGQAGRCYEGLGLQLTGLFQRDDAWIIAQCARGRPALAPRCAAGAAHALGTIDWSGGRGMKFCAMSPPVWKRACYRSAVRILSLVATTTQRTVACGRIEAAYAKICRDTTAFVPDETET